MLPVFVHIGSLPNDPLVQAFDLREHPRGDLLALASRARQIHSSRQCPLREGAMIPYPRSYRPEQTRSSVVWGDVTRMFGPGSRERGLAERGVCSCSRLCARRTGPRRSLKVPIDGEGALRPRSGRESQGRFSGGAGACVGQRGDGARQSGPAPACFRDGGLPPPPPHGPRRRWRTRKFASLAPPIRTTASS